MKRLILISLIFFFLYGCDKDPIPALAPTITTGVASSVENTTATVSISITDISNSKEIGVLYSTISNSLTKTDAQKGSIVNLKSGDNSISLTGLSKGTTYYYKAYATDKYITIYGDMKTFTTGIDYPTLTTNTVSSITSNRTVCGGSITSDGGGSVNARGVCWSTNSNPTVNLATKTVDGTGTGSFTSTITGLQPETFYYIRAYATNEKGTVYGAQITFKTLPISLPTITTTTNVTSITTTTATSGGNITNDGGGTVTSRGVCWSTSSSPTITDSKTFNGTGTGAFTSSIIGLIANTTYYVRAYATNSIGTIYGDEKNFTTTDGKPLLTTNAVINITVTNSTSGGNITSDGGFLVTARGICWSANTNPTIADNHTNNGTGIGSFTSSLTGLAEGTTYYIRAYATNSNGTAYGNITSLTTKTLKIGDSYEGGIVAYIYKAGDAGYITGETHCIIAAPKDLSLENNYTDYDYDCKSLTLGGYLDWRIPTIDELEKLYVVRTILSIWNSIYWSSTGYSFSYPDGTSVGGVYRFNFTTGSRWTEYHHEDIYVRPVRVF